MVDINLETRSVLRQILYGTGRIAWYALFCRSRNMTYVQFVEELEGERRELVRTSDNVIINPATNEALQMNVISAAWDRLDPKIRHRLFATVRALPAELR